jgi:hypothetical protein
MSAVIRLDERRPASILRRVATDLREARRRDVDAEPFDHEPMPAGDGTDFFAQLQQDAPGKLIPLISSLEARSLFEVSDNISAACSIIEGRDVSVLADVAVRMLERAAEFCERSCVSAP